MEKENIIEILEEARKLSDTWNEYELSDKLSELIYYLDSKLDIDK